MTKASTNRAKIILTTLFLLTYISTSTTIYFAYKNGVIHQVQAYASPKIVDFIEKLFTPSKPAPSITPISKPILRATPAPTPKLVIKRQTTITKEQPTNSTTSTFDQEAWDAKIEQMRLDAEARAVENAAEADAWLEQQSSENAAAADEWYEQKKAEAEAERDAWLEEHGF